MNLLSNYQKTLFPYAYNILGSTADAMDAIQDVMVKFVATAKTDLENETAYLVKSVINQSINIKKKNQQITGDTTWLPEPIATEHADEKIVSREIISYAMLVLLEYLNPKERAVFILKEAFDYTHEEIAETLDLSVDNSRKLLSRAKNELKNKNFKPTTPVNTDFLQGYIQSIQKGDTSALATILSNDIAVRTDGGNIRIVSPLVVGTQPVMDLMLYVYNNYQQSLSIQIAQINHHPALLFYNNDLLVNCQVFDIAADNTVQSIFSIVDPEKLKNLLPF